MNGRERILAAAGLAAVDRPPVLPVLLMQGARELGIPLTQYFSNPARLAEGQIRLLERYHHDGVFAFPHIVQDVLPWGADIAFHEGGPPSLSKMAFKTVEDLVAAPIPDPTRHAYLRNTLQAAAELKRQVGNEKLVVGAVIGPFSLATMLLGTGKYLSLLFDDADRFRRLWPPLVRSMVEYSSKWARAQFEAGCDLVVFAEGIASATILDERTFLREAKPVLEEFVRRTKGILALEWVGDGRPFLKHTKDLGVAAFLVGSTDSLVECRRALGPQKALIGNINNIKLQRWEPERIQFEARRAIAQGGKGFILSNQGPEVPWAVPDEAIAALVSAATGSRTLAAAA